MLPDPAVLPDRHAPAQDRAVNSGAGADRYAVHQHGAGDAGSLSDPAVSADDTVRAPLGQRRGSLCGIPEICREISLGRADVAPVSAVPQTEDPSAVSDQLREQLMSEVRRHSLRNVLQHAGREEIDAGIDRIGKCLRHVRLFNKAEHASVGGGQHHAVFGRILRAGQEHGGVRAVFPVKQNGALQVKFTERVAAEDKKVPVPQVILRRFDASRRSERRLLLRVVQPDSLALPSAKRFCLRPEAAGSDHRFRNAVLPEPPQDPDQNRLAADGDKRFRLCVGQRTQTLSLSACHNNCFHRTVIILSCVRMQPGSRCQRGAEGSLRSWTGRTARRAGACPPERKRRVFSDAGTLRKGEPSGSCASRAGLSRPASDFLRAAFLL